MKVDTKAIRARADAATAGPWRGRRHARTSSITSGMPGRDLLVVADVYDDTPEMGGAGGEADAAFLAAARTDVPALCDRVEALEAALRDVLDDFPDARRMPESVVRARAALGDEP